MASILRFLSKKFRYIKYGCYQFGQSCAMEKNSEIQVSRSSNTGAVFFDKSNTGKAQTNDKDPASKESQKSQRTV